MNILGNYKNYHSEWERDVGAGWSPSMTIKSLLVQLQAEFTDGINKQSNAQRMKFYDSCVKYRCRADQNEHIGTNPFPRVECYTKITSP